MGRPKGKTSGYTDRTAEEKLEIIKPVLDGSISASQHGINLGINDGTLSTWIKKYQNGGIEALKNKRKPGNPLVKFQNRKELSYIEKLEYDNLKLRIENERLKKGYTSKEADLVKQKKSSKKNSK